MNSPASEPNSIARALLLGGLFVGANPAFAEMPKSGGSVVDTAKSTQMELAEVQVGLGGGSKTLDSATAAVQGGAGFGALDLSANLHPIPLKGWNGFTFGVEADGRFSGQGWGLGVLEGEFGFDAGKVAVDLGYGRSWDVLDGNRPNTNMDGAPHVSGDLRVQPFPKTSTLHPFVLEASWGTTLPQGTYIHPAFMDVHVAVGFEADLKWPKISSGTSAKAEGAPQNEVSARFNVTTRPLESKIVLPTGTPNNWQKSELVRLTEELSRSVARNAWPAGETNFQKLITGDKLKDLPLTHQAYMDGAEAARSLGDMTAAYERVRLAGLADGKVEQAWLTEVEANYAYVELNESLPRKPEFICAEFPLSPYARAAVLVIVEEVKKTGHYEGLLPLEVQFSWGGVPLPVLKPMSELKEVQVITLEK